MIAAIGIALKDKMKKNIKVVIIPCPRCGRMMKNYKMTMSGFDTGVIFRECPFCQYKTNISEDEIKLPDQTIKNKEKNL